MPGKLAQLNGVLAGHQRGVAHLVGFRMGHIAGGVDRRMRRDLQTVIHLQAALSIAFTVNLLAQRVSLHACGPDHG
ncbi:hypothetical protein D3C75_1142000 [compost metagenome]